MNSTFEGMANDYHILHRLTTAYSFWANDTVESLMRTLLAALRSMMLELNLSPQDWKEIITDIPTVINSAGLEQLSLEEDGGFRSALQVMTGLVPNRPITCIISSHSKTISGISVSGADQQKLTNINDPQNTLRQLIMNVIIKVNARCKKAVAPHNKSTKIVEPNFKAGDFALVRRAVNRGHELQYKWIGPSYIKEVHSPLVYSVAKFNGTESQRVHATRFI